MPREDIVLSLCIASYNVEAFVVQCLDSIKKYENNRAMEVIIVDDCSSDNTVKLIENRKRENSVHYPIHLYVNETNLWPAITYNKAVSSAKWKYISFMDADDFFIASTLEDKIHTMANNSKLEIVYGNGLFFKNNILFGDIHNNIQQYLSQWPNATLDYITSHIPLLTLSSCVMRESFFHTISGFDEKSLSNDWLLNIKIFSHITQGTQYYINYTKAFAYRINPLSISTNIDRMIELQSYVIKHCCQKKAQNKLMQYVYFVAAIKAKQKWQFLRSRRYFRISQTYKISISKCLLFAVTSIVPAILLLRIEDYFFEKKHITQAW